MGIENDHDASQSFVTGDSISPRIFTVPARSPHIFLRSRSAGTSFATGLPCLVISTNSPVSWTLSMSARQLALNLAAGTVFMWSFYCDHIEKSRLGASVGEKNIFASAEMEGTQPL